MAGIRSSELGLIINIVLLLAGVVDPSLTLYPNMGETLTLPCANMVHQNTSCPSTTWLYKNNTRPLVEEVAHGKVRKDMSARADRLSVGSNCSLIIHGVTAEDVGQYTCRQFPPTGGSQIAEDIQVFLSLLTISSSTSVLNPGTSVTLTCYLSTLDGPGVCIHSLMWLDEDGNDLQTDSTVQGTQSHCKITLTVTKSATSRRFRCRLMNSTKQTVKDAFIDLPPNVFAVTLGAVLFLVAVIIIVILIFYRKREIKRKKSTADTISLKTVGDTSTALNVRDSISKAHKDVEELEHITYASIDLHNSEKNPSKTITQANDAVTYASVGVSSGRGTAPDNLNDLYATVNKPL